MSVLSLLLSSVKALQIKSQELQAVQDLEQDFMTKLSSGQIQEFFDIEQIIKSVPSSTSPRYNQPLSRDKRFAPLIAAGIGIISGVLGTFLGMYSAVEISILKDRLNTMGKNHNLLVQVTKKQEEQIHRLTENMNAICSIIKMMVKYNPALIAAQISAQLDLVESRLTRATNAVQQLQHRRLAVDLLDTYQLTEMQKAVTEIAEKRGYTLLPTQGSDYFQLETSYLRRGPDILIMLHVPCVINDQLLTIYNYVPFPYPLNVMIPTDVNTINDLLNNRMSMYEKAPNEEISDALVIVPEAEMIAIGQGNSYKILSQADLASCVKRSSIFLCEKHQVLQTDLSQTCLGSIFSTNVIGVKQNCKLERKKLRETVYQISATDHLVFTPKPYSANINCRNGSSFPTYITQTFKLSVPEDCKIKLVSHSIQSDYNIRIAPPPLAVPWEMDPMLLPAELFLDAAVIDMRLNSVHKSLQSLMVETANKTDFTTMINDTLSHPASFPWYIWAIFVIVSLLTMFIFLWYVYNCMKKREYRRADEKYAEAHYGRDQEHLQLNIHNHPAANAPAEHQPLNPNPNPAQNGVGPMYPPVD